jgi:hypothetical protein
MTIKRVLPAISIAACLLTLPATADDLFTATLRVTERGLGSSGKLTNTRVNEKDIITAATGATGSSLKNFALVYNATADALQVVDSTGAVVTNVMQFAGGAFTSDSKQSDRLTFIFLPDQSEASGSAILAERAAKAQTGTAKDRVSISGNLQFFLANGQTLGGSGATGGGTNTNAVATAAVVNGSSGSPAGPNGGSTKWFATNANGQLVFTNSTLGIGTETNGTGAANGTTGGATAQAATPSVSSTNTTSASFFTLASLTQTNTGVLICTAKLSAGKRFVGSSATNTNGTGTNATATVVRPSVTTTNGTTTTSTGT